jgi:hypothetical protein
MKVDNTTQALQVWNCQSCQKAESATYVKHDGLFVLKDGRGRMIGAVTSGGEVLDSNQVNTFRALAH